MRHETLLTCRRLFDKHQVPQPPGGDQNAVQPAEAPLPGEEADASPVLRQPVQDLHQPRAEQQLHAEHEEAQQWRAQAMRLAEELQSAHSTARSERSAFAVQLHRARTSMAGAVSQFEHDRAQIAKLTRLSEYWEEQFHQSTAAIKREATAAKLAQAEVFMAAQKVVLQRRDEQEARAAAEQRAADLEQKPSGDKAAVSEQLEASTNAEQEARTAAECRAATLQHEAEAQGLRIQALESENRRISACNAAVSRRSEAVVREEREARRAAESMVAGLRRKLELLRVRIQEVEGKSRRITADSAALSQRCEASVSAEREAREAAESRAADLELRLEAEKLRTGELEEELKRISAENAEVSRDYEAALGALGDLDLNASKDCNEEVEKLSKSQEARQAAAKKEAQLAADLAASRAATEQQLADPWKSNQVGTIIFHGVLALHNFLGS